MDKQDNTVPLDDILFVQNR